MKAKSDDQRSVETRRKVVEKLGRRRFVRSPAGEIVGRKKEKKKGKGVGGRARTSVVRSKYSHQQKGDIIGTHWDLALRWKNDADPRLQVAFLLAPNGSPRQDHRQGGWQLHKKRHPRGRKTWTACSFEALESCN